MGGGTRTSAHKHLYTLFSPPSTGKVADVSNLTMRQSENRAGLALIAPTAIVLAVVVLFPLLWALSMAFQKVKLINIGRVGLFGEYTLDNFVKVLSSESFYSSLGTTIVYTFGSTFGSVVVGLIAALALWRPFRGRSLVRGLVLLPYVAPVVAVAFVWTTVLNPQFGAINVWGQQFLGWDRGIPFLSQESTALATVIAFEIWRYFPFAFLFLIARLQAFSRETQEAAIIDGATPFQKFVYIDLPQLIPTMATIFLIRAIFTFNKFDDVYLLTGGGSGTEVVSIKVFYYLIARKDVGLASAQAIVLAVAMIILIFVQSRLFKNRDEEGNN